MRSSNQRSRRRQYISTLVISTFLCAASWELTAYEDVAIKNHTAPKFPADVFNTIDIEQYRCMPEVYAYLGAEFLAENLGLDDDIVSDAFEQLDEQVCDCLNKQLSEGPGSFPWFTKTQASTRSKDLQYKGQDQDI